MGSNFQQSDNTFGSVDLDEVYITEDWLVDQFVGNQLWAWGFNGWAQLGLNNQVHRSSPTQVGILTTWQQVVGAVDTGTCAHGIKTDGTLWSWGYNSSGQLGINAAATGGDRSSPVQVGALTNWKQVTNSGAIKTDGTLWTWGSGNAGALGLNTITNRSSPTQVGTLTNWNLVSSSNLDRLAIKTDGTLWAWGRNTVGNLGLNDKTDKSSPVQVGTLTNWKQVYVGVLTTYAIKTDGTLWAWGNNGIGNLGLNDTVHRSSPTQVGTMSNWKIITFSGNNNCATAIKTDGTLWAWGNNADGSLGLNDRVHRSSPVQVGTLTNWKMIAGATAIKTDGTLWAWGNNAAGYLGLGTITHRSSPTQVGTLTNWKQVSFPYYGVVAITYTDIG